MIGPLDVIVGWSGTGLVPNPAITDVAHRNGALCLGLIFQPDKRVFDSSIVPARRVASQYARLASYFGYDGYFVNFESGTPAEHEQVLAFITMMREEARRLGEANFYVQFYDGSSDMDQLLPKVADAPGHAHSEADSVMLDQGWSGYSMVRGCCSGRPRTPEQVRQYCENNGLDPFRSAYFGFQLYPGPGYLGVAAPSVISPNGAGSAFGSLQIYSYEDGFWTMRKAATAKAAQPLPPSQTEDAFYDLERRFFSGQSGNPALTNKPSAEQARLYAKVAEGTRRYADYSPTTDPSIEQVTLPITYGVANFTVERSVIGSFPFLTRFNIGAGQHFFLEGKQVSSRPWFNLGIQSRSMGSWIGKRVTLPRCVFATMARSPFMAARRFTSTAASVRRSQLRCICTRPGYRSTARKLISILFGAETLTPCNILPWVSSSKMRRSMPFGFRCETHTVAAPRRCRLGGCVPASSWASTACVH
jgi:hypothetical protein